MSLSLIDAGLKLGNGVVSVIDQLVEDKDLAAKLKFQLASNQQEFMKSVYGSEHTPTIVKLLYAFRDLVIPMMRPVGSVLMPAFLVYAKKVGVEIPTELIVATGALFPGWMYSRHKDKDKAKETEVEIEREKTKRAQIGLDQARVSARRPTDHYTMLNPDIG